MKVSGVEEISGLRLAEAKADPPCIGIRFLGWKRLQD